MWVICHLTRGDGGQNLIGSELRELLGVIRTQELLAARRIDGGEQFFTRANDFGYSKHPDEAFSIWNKESGGSMMWFGPSEISSQMLSSIDLTIAVRALLTGIIPHRPWRVSKLFH